MVDAAAARALGPGATDHGQLAALAVVVALGNRATYGHAKEQLAHIAGATSVAADVRGEAALLARSLSADEGTEAGRQADRQLGVVDALSVLGPFRDTGGGLDAHDGPEGPSAPFDAGARYSWGSYEVAWRELPREFATAIGVPLDVFVFPRKESCTWVATRLTVPLARRLTVRAAASGQVRLVFDGLDVARQETVHEAARFDRMAGRVDAEAGDHLLAAKVCSGALDDDGRVRLRVTDDAGFWPEGVRATAALAGASVTPPKRAAVHAEATPLGRAMGQDGGDVDARVDGIVLRTLGGADDMRSPRAAGLVAALADGGPGPDRLAMAAWVTPAGASRSAWLNRAIQGADGKTRAFIERRLVERHLQAQLADWAMASLRGAKVDVERDAEAVLLSAQAELALGTDAMRLLAMQHLAALDRASAPSAGLDLLAHTAEGVDPGLAMAAREALAVRGDRGIDRVRVVASTRGRAEAVRAAREAFEGGVGDADDAIAVAQVVARTGAHDEARSLYERLARWAPNRSGVWAGLAQETAAAPPTAGGDAAQTGVIAAMLRRARELDPGEARYRAELALRTRAQTLDVDARDDEKYIVSSQVILARRQRSGSTAADAAPLTVASGEAGQRPIAATSAAPDVADRQLHWLRAVVMHADRRVSEMVHYAREIVIAPRTEEELYEEIPAEGDLTEILRARVHRKDGGTALPVEEANENAHPRIRWPELATGDVVEVAFRSWTAGPVGGRGDPPFYRLDYAGALSTHPVLYNEVVVETHAGDPPIFVDVVNGTARPAGGEGRTGIEARGALGLEHAEERSRRAARARRSARSCRRSCYRRSRTGTHSAPGTARPSTASPSRTRRCATSPRSSPRERRHATGSSARSSTSWPTTFATSTT